MNGPADILTSLDTKEISLFVALPYTDFGEHSKWRHYQDFESFYQEVRKSIEKRLAPRTVRLHIEQDIPKSGSVIDSMFGAIHASDVFIADITGSNANVFFELGVRYGVSKGITILTSNEDRPAPFDIRHMYVVRYWNGRTEPHIEEIAEIVAREIDKPQVSSPVIKCLDIEIVPRKTWEVVSSSRVKMCIAQSQQANDPDEKLEYIKQALEVDRLCEEAHIELAILLRIRDNLDSALSEVDNALHLFPKSAKLLKERGKVLDKMATIREGCLELALSAYEQALVFDDEDADLHGCYGGVLRRIGLKATDDVIRNTHLQASLAHYQRSIVLNRHSSYAGLNVLRLLMLMSETPNGRCEQIDRYMERMYHLCSFNVTDSAIMQSKEHWWPMFDLADVFALKEIEGERKRAILLYKEAVARVPEHQKNDTLISPFRTWSELLASGKLNKGVSDCAEEIVTYLKSEIKPKAM